MKKILLISATLLCMQQTYGQTEHAIPIDECYKIGSATCSPLQTAPCSGVMTFQQTDPKWKVSMHHSEVSDNNAPDQNTIDAIKQQKLNIKFNSRNNSATDNNSAHRSEQINSITTNLYAGLQPVFQGSCPQDNNMAVSNAGLICSTINSDVAIYNATQNYVQDEGFFSFANRPNLSNVLCDPWSMYDPVADRFIFVFIVCTAQSAGDSVIIAFSQTNNPAGAWNVYTISGDPLSNGDWMDYPKAGFSNNELFVTGNLFNGGNQQYDQAVCFQIDKNKGYAGQPITYLTWTGIAGSPFTLIPATYGQQGNYGPGIYMVSTGASSGSTIGLYQITNDQYHSPALNSFSVNTQSYAVAGPAAQLGWRTYGSLNNDDCRVKNAFYLNGIIHFVYNRDLTGNSGWNAIAYNRLNVSTRKDSMFLFSEPGVDDCYPAVASYSNNPADETVVISYVQGDSTKYPLSKLVACAPNGTFSSPVVLKNGAGTVQNCLQNGMNRWGDYSGCQRQYNSCDVWTSTSYGAANGYWNTWLQQIAPQSPGSCIPLNVDEAPTVQLTPLTISPNPVSTDFFHLEFTAPDNGFIKVAVYDMTGKMVKDLYNGYIWKGENNFSFNKGALATGTYILSINGNPGDKLATAKFEVIH